MLTLVCVLLMLTRMAASVVRQYPQRYTHAVMERIHGAFAMSEYHALQMPLYALPKVCPTAPCIRLTIPPPTSDYVVIVSSLCRRYVVIRVHRARAGCPTAPDTLPEVRTAPLHLTPLPKVLNRTCFPCPKAGSTRMGHKIGSSGWAVRMGLQGWVQCLTVLRHG